MRGSCQEKQGPSKVGNLISAESCSRKRCSSGGGVQIHSHGALPKSTRPKHLHFFLFQKPLCISFILIFSRSEPHSINWSLYLLRLSRSRVQAKKAWSGRYHISHLCLPTGVKGNENQVPHVTRRSRWLNLALLAKGHYLHLDLITSTVDYRIKGQKLSSCSDGHKRARFTHWLKEQSEKDVRFSWSKCGCNDARCSQSSL